MKLSIVATLYHSSAHLDEFHARATAAARMFADDDFEIVYVNDGSPDDSLDKVVAIADADPHTVVVDLSRNFGHHKAMVTGLSYARGDRVFLIDSDLEEDPEYLAPFAAQMAERGCDVVFGIQDSRKGGWFERWSGLWFYRLFRLITGLDLPENMVTARLMTRRYVDALLRHQEREVFMAGLWHITGFDQQPFAITKHSTSDTTYTLRRKIALLVNSVTSFSNAPLVHIFNVGALIFLGAITYVAYLCINWIFLAKPLTGWTSVMASIWLLGGMIISFIGVIGIYLSKVFSEAKQRPYTIVRRVYGRQD